MTDYGPKSCIFLHFYWLLGRFIDLIPFSGINQTFREMFYQDRQMIKKKIFIFSGLVPKPASQVASTGEAGGELHQASGYPFLVFALFQSFSHQLSGLRAAAGALALHPDHHLHFAAVALGLRQQLARPPRHLHAFSSSAPALFLAIILPQLPSPGTQLSPASHQLYVPAAPGIPVLSWSEELQYCFTEDEG